MARERGVRTRFFLAFEGDSVYSSSESEQSDSVCGDVVSSFLTWTDEFLRLVEPRGVPRGLRLVAVEAGVLLLVATSMLSAGEVFVEGVSPRSATSRCRAVVFARFYWRSVSVWKKCIKELKNMPE